MEDTPESYWAKITRECCPSTESGWLWYCDTHHRHGSADSEAEAHIVAQAHEAHRLSGYTSLCAIFVAGKNVEDY